MYNKLLGICVLICLISAKSSGQCNNVNIAAGRPQNAAFGSATSNLGEPWRAFDSDEYAGQTKWTSNSTDYSAYIGIDLGTSYNICSIYLSMGSLDYATSFKIQGSNDMSNWTDLISLTNNTANVLTVDNLPTSGNYRYVRVLFVNRIYSWSNYTVYDFEVFNRVVNDPPNVTLTAPSAGASYIQGTNIDITANAADINGSISKVEFYQGTTKLGEDATAPYSYTWTGAALGGYAIRAKAIDNGGAFTWSDSAHITVAVAPASMRNWIATGNNINNSNSGYVAIGGLPTQLPADTAIKLAVKGTIYAKKLTVTQTVWADYVFNKNYLLRPLPHVEKYIKANNHLPDVPSAAEIAKDGVSIGDNQALLLKKIEELTLYIIEMDKEIKGLKRKVKHIHPGK